MCMQDLAIEQRLRTDFATYDTTALLWRAPADPYRHALIVTTDSSPIIVRARTRIGLVDVYVGENFVYDGGAGVFVRLTAVLRREDYGDILANELEILNGLTTSFYSPKTVTLDAELGAALARVKL